MILRRQRPRLRRAKRTIVSALLCCATIILSNVISCACCNADETLTPKQWVEKYTCNQPELARRQEEKSSWRQTLLGDKCDRDPINWRLEYANEINDPFKVRIKEDSIDERLANSIDLVKQTKVIQSFGRRVHAGKDDNYQAMLESVAGPQVDNQLCRVHLNQMLDLIQELNQKLQAKRKDPSKALQLEIKHIHLARVLDSFGRYGSGFLSGKYNSIGAYQQCRESQLLLPNQTKTIRTRYCWAHFDLAKHSSPSLRSRKLSKYVWDETFLSAGICLPESCHTKSFQMNQDLLQELVNRQFKLPQDIYVGDDLDLTSIYCIADENSEYSSLTIGAKLFILILIIWITLVIIATSWYSKPKVGVSQVPDDNNVCNNGCNNGKPQPKHTQQQPRQKQLLALFNLESSWSDFVGENEKQRIQTGVDLDPLNAIKAISCFIILLAHSCGISYSFATNFIHASRVVDTRLLSLMCGSYFFVVDAFLVISGLLVGYVGVQKVRQWTDKVSNKRQQGDQFNLTTELKQFASVWLKLATFRYIRIVPLVFTVFWFEKSVFTYLGSGPMWDEGLDSVTEIGGCLRTSWLRPFDFITPLELGRNCVDPAWYIYCDLYAQIIFVPPLVYLMAKKCTKSAYTLTIGIILLSTHAAYKEFMDLNPGVTYEFRQLHLSTTFAQEEYGRLYAKSFYRLTRVLIGLLAGYALFNYQLLNNTKNKFHKPWPKWFRTLATWLAALTIIILSSGAPMQNLIKKHMYPEYYALPLLQLTLIPLIWSTSLAILLLRLLTDCQDNWLAKMGRNKVTKSLNRLGFIIFLIHWYVYIYHFTTVTSDINFTAWLFYSTFGMAYFYSSIIALFVFLFIENPLMKLIRELTGHFQF